MARTKTAATAPSGASAKTSRNGRLSNAERSAYFARREAAKVLRLVLRGDARRRAVGSIKSLVYSPSVKNKKATFALVCQTLKHLSIIKQVLDSASILNSKWKEISLVGDAEKFLMLHKGAIQSALARLLVRNKVKSIEDLMALYQTPDVPKPRYVRVNTLKMDVDSAVLELGKQFVVQKDDLVPDLLILPPGCDLHDHPLIVNGCVFLQGKASSMVAAALAPKPGWKVLDACSAPGNKTVHLAALMKGKGKIVACELNKERVRRLKDTIKLSGAANIEVLHGDFLNLDPKDPAYSEVRAILLDPSCSGSGTAAERLDHLLPSHASGHTADPTEMERLNKLSAFQKKALRHALSFPGVERVVYSTCSIHQVENEDVIKSVLPIAMSFGFQLATSFPQWNCRGLPVFEGSEHLLRTDPVEDKEGFFIALFVKGNIIDRSKNPTMPSSYNSKVSEHIKGNKTITKTKRMKLFMHNRMFKIWSHCLLRSRRLVLDLKNDKQLR
ncbi:probable 28S rRNA (cytosine-C(5))-methyltransferase isoform X2 [Citrus clementina]|uniref:probable 28S rRNA (cytosine-C(5))-methyltransferase isoform X2 n=1 Tax=Citrus clementina TaxID=85681 RepID=UPI000CED6592|nr:probable 28S rRNA (cytosine-C(5))-methyltransferase isoform X2 [Citrus x clementina]